MRRHLHLFLSLTLLAGLLALAPASAAAAGEAQAGHPHGGEELRLIGNSPKPDTVNSDLAFSGDIAVQGNYGGFRLIDIGNPRRPEVLSDVACNGAQGDVSVYDNLVFVSVDSPQTVPTCDSTNTVAPPGGTRPTGFEGIRVFDISDPTAPQFLTAVPTDCGSHTHTLVPDGDRVLIYVSSYPTSGLGPTPYGTTCEQPHSKISVVEVPLDHPEQAAVVNEPELPLSDFIAPSLGLTAPGIRGCHDIGVFLELGKAASACLGEGQIWDISDPVNPVVLERITNPEVEIWHAAGFTWDGEVAVFGDEWGGGGVPGACQDPLTGIGRFWFYDTEHPSDGPLGSYKIPRPQTADEVCTAHNFNVVPVADRYVMVSAWYLGGTSVVDFTDPANPVETAYYDGAGDYWSSYWYNGRIYGSDIVGGLDIFRGPRSLRRGERFDTLNPQTQEHLIRDHH